MIQDIDFAFVYQTVDHLSEQRVDPRKPGAGEFGRIILVERFVHESGIGIRVAKHLDTFADFLVVVCRVTAHDDTHRPDISETDMRTADAFAGFALEASYGYSGR